MRVSLFQSQLEIERSGENVKWYVLFFCHGDHLQYPPEGIVPCFLHFRILRGHNELRYIQDFFLLCFFSYFFAGEIPESNSPVHILHKKVESASLPEDVIHMLL